MYRWMGSFLALLVLLSSSAWAVLPANEQWREQLIGNFGGTDRRVGYGRNATGGAGGTLCTVSNLNDSGAGSLRACLLASGPQWVIFSVSGTINLATRIEPQPPGGNDKTLDGRGASIVINGGTSSDVIVLGKLTNWIIHDVAMTNAGGGGGGGFIFRMLCTETVWVDHVDFTGAGDNLVTITIGSDGGTGCGASNTNAATDITLSYLKMHDRCNGTTTACGSGMILVGHSPTNTIMANTRLTLHHNWYQQTGDERNPFARFGKFHSFNNYYDNVDQGAMAKSSARWVSEGDIFQCNAYGGSGPPLQCNFTFSGTLRVKCTAWPDEGDASTCKVTNFWAVTATETAEQLNAGSSFNPATDYSYASFLETANAALRSKITNATTGAGAVSNPYSYHLTGLTDGASHGPPSDYETWTPVAGGFPTVGAGYVDPIFGSTITRLSAVATGNTGPSIQYQRRGQFNHTSTAWLHDTGGSGVEVINPATGAVLRAVSVPFGAAEVTFVPAAGWETRYLYTSGTTLRSYDYATTADVVVKDFGGGNTLGETGGTGDIITADGCLMVLHISTNLRIWDRCTDTLYTGSVPFPTTGTLAIQPGHAGITPDGSFMVIHGNATDNTGTQLGHVSYAINRTTQTLSTTQVMFWNGCQDHGALVTGTNGVNYLVTGNCYANVATRGIVAISVGVDRTGLTVDQQIAQARLLFPVSESNMLGSINVGCAGRGVQQDWCVVSINSPTDSIGSPGTWYAYKSELVAVQVISPWQVVRIAHHRARDSNQFCRNPRPTMNWDGSRVIFASNMSSNRAPFFTGSTCSYADTYTIALSEAVADVIAPAAPTNLRVVSP